MARIQIRASFWRVRAQSFQMGTKDRLYTRLRAVQCRSRKGTRRGAFVISSFGPCEEKTCFHKLGVASRTSRRICVSQSMSETSSGLWRVFCKRVHFGCEIDQR